MIQINHPGPRPDCHSSRCCRPQTVTSLVRGRFLRAATRAALDHDLAVRVGMVKLQTEPDREPGIVSIPGWHTSCEKGRASGENKQPERGRLI
jgi:hypothetical protein